MGEERRSFPTDSKVLTPAANAGCEDTVSRLVAHPTRQKVPAVAVMLSHAIRLITVNGTIVLNENREADAKDFGMLRTLPPSGGR